MTSAKPTDESLAQLRRLGFDPVAPPAEAIAKLASLKKAENEVAIARALGQIATLEAAEMLAQMEVGASGVLRREVRRSLFRLRQHGIEAPAAPDSNIGVAQPADGDTGLSGMMSVADAEGARIVWVVKSRPGSGLKRLWALISESEGLVAVTSESLSRKDLRSDRAEIEKRAGARMIDADWRLVDFIMCEAYRGTPEARRGRVGSFLALRTEIITNPPTVDFHHPVYDEFPAEAGSEPHPDLMKEPEIAAYKLPDDTIKALADEVTQLQQSTLVLNRMVQEERVNTVLDRAIGQLLTSEIAYRLRRRLEDTAYYFARISKRTQAGWAVAAAVKLRDGVELKRSAFFQVFMRAQLGAILAEEQEKQQEQPRLIVTPAEMMRARAAAQGRMGPRGRLR